MKQSRRVRFGVCLGCALITGSVVAPAVGTRRFVLQSGADFQGGDLQGVAVDSSGKVRAGFSLSATPIPQADTVWAAIAQRDGSLVIGTGNQGKLIRLKAGVSSLLAETKALAITSLVEVEGASLVLGTIPEGKLMRFERGKLSPWVDLKGADHVWQVAYDPKQRAVYAATGPEGKLFRIGEDGRAQVYFDAEEQQLMCVAVGGDGTVYAGASDKAKLYKIEAPGRATVLYDFGRTEVKAVSVSAKGDVYAIANEIKAGAQLPTRQTQSPEAQPASPTQVSAPAKGKGTLYRFFSDGRPDELLNNEEEYFSSLALDEDGHPYVGTGLEGRVYTVDTGHNSVLVADIDERQVTALALQGTTRFVVGSDPAVVHLVKGSGGPDAVWTSKVLDAGIRARYGRIEWEASGALSLSTRTGNTKEPDDTWSPWSREFTEAGKVESPSARYLQIRARFAKDPHAVLTDVSVSFMTDNLRAVITEFVAKASGESGSSKKDEVVASGGPISRKPATTVDLTWKVDNPDKDELRYRLKYRLLGTKNWYDLTKPEEKVTKENYAWETSDLPEGRYRLQLTASDELSNPPDRVTNDTVESGLVLVDNTPPTIEGLKLEGRRLVAVVVDGVGPIQRVEVSVAGSDDWQPVLCRDGILDEQREELDADLSGVLPNGPALISVRAYDGADNFVVRSLELR